MKGNMGHDARISAAMRMQKTTAIGTTKNMPTLYQNGGRGFGLVIVVVLLVSFVSA